MQRLFALLAVVLASPCAGQVVAEMTPDRIREAIAAADQPPSTRDRMMCDTNCVNDLVLFVHTPFSSVETAARAAKRKYLPFTEKDVTPAMLTPFIDVYVPAYMTGDNIGSDVISVEHVVVAPTNEATPSKVTQPVSIEKEPADWSAASGAHRHGEGVTARFPLSVLVPGNEFRVILSNRREAIFKLTPEFLGKIR